METIKKVVTISFLLMLVVGCAGTSTFNLRALRGETIIVAAGYTGNFSRDNITVTITDSAGETTVYSPGSTKVRASVNLYPDPLSSWVVSDRTGVDKSPYALTYVGQNNFHNTNDDYDWYQTAVFIDLPVNMDSGTQPLMAEGLATVLIETPAGPDYESVSATVTIGSGTGTPHTFNAISKLGAPFTMDNSHIQALERLPHQVLSFSGTTVPYAIQVDLSHDGDQDNGGDPGDVAYVANPVGHIKSMNWHDDGTNTRIILLPNRDSDISSFNDFKVYLTGLAGWAVVDATGYTIDGAELVAPDDITATIAP